MRQIFYSVRSILKDTEKRNPTITEIRVIDTYWSDHCRHTTFATHINDVTFEDGKYKEVVENVYKMYLDEKKSLGYIKKIRVSSDIFADDHQSGSGDGPD